jgi:hypothetical protein
MKTIFLTLFYVTLLSSGAYSQTGAIREGSRGGSTYIPPRSSGSGGYGSGSQLYIPPPDYSDLLPSAGFDPTYNGPVFENASPFPPCAFCENGPYPYDYENPAGDLPTYEEMNPNIDPYFYREEIEGPPLL